MLYSFGVLGEDVMRTIWLVIGVIVFLAGAVFTLQGVGILGGSSMSGSRTWAILGPIIALVGLALAVWGARQRKA
jgi:hypothetical protein